MRFILVLLLALPPLPIESTAQIPAGTILPVTFESSLSLKSRPGEAIRARIMQDVPLGGNFKIPAGSKVFGSVVESDPASAAPKGEISFSLDGLRAAERTYKIVTGLRALASPVAIDDAQIPDSGPDRGTPPSAYTTHQVGGEVVYRGGGHVMSGKLNVAEPAPGGVLGVVRENLSRGCRGPVDGNDRPQALWVFSTNACGVYGYSGMTIVHEGRDEPLGKITIRSANGKTLVRGGTGMLLRVLAPSEPKSAAQTGLGSSPGAKH